MQKQLISELSPTLESKSVFVSERGLTSTQWSEYSENTKRIQYSAVPTSDITAEAVTVDGFVLSQKDTASVVTTATRPLAIQKDATWYTYGWDLTKNICEVFGPAGYLRTAYTYTPYGQVTANGDVEQPIQWSSEFNDTELGLIYYNYRHYNPVDGRWTGRDPEESTNLMSFSLNTPTVNVDILGRRPNINLLPRKKVANSDKTEYELAEANINYSSYFVIVAHGNPNWIADADKIVYDAKYLAHLMIQRGYKYDKHVLLIACETGQRFAQHLANELENRRKKDNKCSKSKIFVYAPMRKTQIKFDEDQRQIELYQERMHISIIGEKYEYINGMKIVLPQIGVSYKYDLKAELYKFTPNTK